MRDTLGAGLISASLQSPSPRGVGAVVSAKLMLKAAGIEAPMDSNQAMLRAMRREQERESDKEERSPTEIVESVCSDPGMPLPDPVREKMERAFGKDFSHVRVHTDGAAGNAAAGLQAQAFALGSHIYFGHGAWSPGDSSGDKLLAHELTHVVQSDEGRLPAASGGEARVSSPDEPAELEAVQNETAILANIGEQATAEAPTEEQQPAPETKASAPTPQAQRKAMTKGKRKKDAGVVAIENLDAEDAYKCEPGQSLKDWVQTVWTERGHTKKLKGPRKRLFTRSVVRDLAKMFRRVERDQISFKKWIEKKRKRKGRSTDSSPFQARYQAILTRQADHWQRNADLTSALWKALGLGPITGRKTMGYSIHKSARNAWNALSKTVDMVIADAGGAITGKEPKVQNEVVAALRAWKRWVQIPQDLNDFVRFCERTGPPLPAGHKERVKVIAAAEAALVSLSMSKIGDARSMTAQKWLGVTRDAWQGVSDLPPWHFYEQNIQPFTFLGKSTGKASGLHADVVSALKAVESDINKKGINTKDMKLSFYGFRMQHKPSGGSQHARGRAFDLSPARLSPCVRGQSVALMSALSGERFEQHSLNYKKSIELATKLAKGESGADVKALQDGQAADAGAIYDKLRSAEAGLKGGWASLMKDKKKDPYDDAALELERRIEDQKTKLGEATKAYNDIPKKQRKKRKDAYAIVKAHANAVRKHEAGLAWNRLDMDKVRKKVTEARDELRREPKKNRAAKRYLRQLNALLKTLAVDPQLTKAQMRLSEKRQEKLKDKKRPAHLKKQRRMLTGSGRRTATKPAILQLVRDGIFHKGNGGSTKKKTAKTEQGKATPKAEAKDPMREMVQAFARNGWSWGAGWRGCPFDSMHFELRRPAKNVKG